MSPGSTLKVKCTPAPHPKQDTILQPLYQVALQLLLAHLRNQGAHYFSTQPIPFLEQSDYEGDFPHALEMPPTAVHQLGTAPERALERLLPQEVFLVASLPLPSPLGDFM